MLSGQDLQSSECDQLLCQNGNTRGGHIKGGVAERYIGFAPAVYALGDVFLVISPQKYWLPVVKISTDRLRQCGH
jgi:hypothetical protein